jgi:hypothetical protein
MTSPIDRMRKRIAEVRAANGEPPAPNYLPPVCRGRFQKRKVEEEGLRAVDPDGDLWDLWRDVGGEG